MKAIEFINNLIRRGYTKAEIMLLERLAFENAVEAHEGMEISPDKLYEIGRDFVLDNLDMFDEYIGKTQGSKFDNADNNYKMEYIRDAIDTGKISFKEDMEGTRVEVNGYDFCIFAESCEEIQRIREEDEALIGYWLMETIDDLDRGYYTEFLENF